MMTHRLQYAIPAAILALTVSFSSRASEEYTGTVVPLAVEKVCFGTDAAFLGYTNFVARLGEIIQPSITDVQGNIISEGTPLCGMKQRPWAAAFNASKITVKTSDAILKLAKINKERYNWLAPSGAVSREQSTDAEEQYLCALGSYENSLSNFVENRAVLDSCTTLAPFEGIVTKHFFVQGNATSRPPTLEIEELNPIGIEVKMPPDKLEKYSDSVPVTIIPQNSGRKFGILKGMSIFKQDSIILRTQNYPVIGKDQILQDPQVPVLRNWFPVKRFRMDSVTDDIISVSTNALQDDANGTYVWKARGQKEMLCDKGVGHFFQIEKVYVKPSGLERYYSGFTKLAALEKTDDLKLDELVLLNPPKDLKDGETVCFPQARYFFMPGDKVKVIFGDNNTNSQDK